MVELRKRKAPAEPAAPPPTKKSSLVKKAATKAKETITGKTETATNGASTSGKPSLGDLINLEGFGGEVETNDATKTTLKLLVEESKNGVVLFTYPKASTPGCTTQACMFRDEFTPLTATGLSIYGLSTDSPKSNTTFKSKQNLPYTLLCDPSASLIAAIGMKKAPKGTTRGVFVIDKLGKVLAIEAGGPAATVEVVRKLVTSAGVTTGEAASEDIGKATEGSNIENEVGLGNSSAEKGELPAENGDVEKQEDAAKADVAADVADSAEKLDQN